ncbi:MAG: ABC transporter substrate-binding protein [Terriglobia bacterium]
MKRLSRRATRTPRRIVSLAPSATSILCALGARKYLVGVTRWCRDVAPVNGLPTLGDCWQSDPARVAALKPDLVIGSVPYRAEVVKALLDRNLTLLAMNPLSLKDIFSDIRLLGPLVGREKQAEALEGALERKFEQVADRARRLNTRPAVYCESWPNPLMLSPPWVEEMVALAGGRFVPAGGGRIVAKQEVLAVKPEIVVLAWTACGMRVAVNKVLRRQGWLRLPALRRRQVYVVSDEALNTPGPPLAAGLQRLAKIIHPEIFGPSADGKLARLGQGPSAGRARSGGQACLSPRQEER